MSSSAPTSHAPAAHYDRVTDAWGLLLGDDLHYGVFARGNEPLAAATAALTARMVDAARLESGLRLLDVGCGTGAPACHLAAQHGVDVLGITTSDVGIGAATQRAERAGLGMRVRFERRDGLDNRLTDSSFDRVWALESSHLMRPRDRFVAECARVLRPGGRFVLCDIVLRRPMPFTEVRRLREPLGVLRDAFGDAHMELLDRYAGWARDHGLDVDHVEDLTEATRPTFERWRANAHRHRTAVVDLIGEAGWDTFVRATSVLEQLWDDGTLGYGLLSATR